MIKDEKDLKKEAAASNDETAKKAEASQNDKDYTLSDNDLDSAAGGLQSLQLLNYI